MSKRPAPVTLSFRDKLPPGFARVADLLGDGPLLALIEAYGGTRMYVPKFVREEDFLAGGTGFAPMERLVRAFAGETLLVPLCKPWRMALLRQQGLSYAAIGRRVGMTEKGVQRAMASAQASPGPDRSAQLRLWT